MSSKHQIIARLSALDDLGRWSEMTTLCRKSFANYPEDGLLWTWLGYSLFKLEQYKEALPALEKACSLSPEKSWGFVLLSLCLQCLERMEDSFLASERALALAPDLASSHIRVSRVARLSGNFERAWEAAFKARELDPQDQEPWANLSWNAVKEFLWEDAYTYTKEALTLDPNHFGNHARMGTIAKELGHREEAREHYTRSVNINPSYESAYLDLAQMLFEDGEEKTAFSVLERCTKANPKGAAAYTLSDKALQYDKVEYAYKVAKEGIKNNPEDSNMLCMLARCCERKGDYVEAEVHCRKAVEVWPTGYSLRMHAMALSDLGRYKDALVVSQKAIDTRRGDRFNWLTHLGILRRSGETEQAFIMLKKVMADYPEVGWLWSDMAKMNAIMGDFDSAKKACEELLTRREKVLRYRCITMRIAGLSGDLNYLEDLFGRLKKLPEEKSRFGIRMLKEAELQYHAFVAVLKNDWESAEIILNQGLEDASRRDSFSCTMVCLTARLEAAKGDFLGLMIYLMALLVALIKQ